MSKISADSIVGRSTASPTFPNGVVITGVATATTFNGNATGLTGTPNITVGNVVGSSATFTNLTVNGTQTIINTTSLEIADKTVGIASTSTPSDALADGAGIVVYGTTNKSLLWYDNSDSFTFSDGIDIKGAVETVSVASTYSLSNDKFILECNAQNGTVFTHTIPTGGNIGIVSFKNFPATKNSITTFTIFITQNSAGTGNTTAATGIGTNIRLWPTGGTVGLTTSARVSTASTITLPTTGLDVDIVTFAVHYNGAGAATTTNYTVYASDTSSFRFGSIRP